MPLCTDCVGASRSWSPFFILELFNFNKFSKNYAIKTLNLSAPGLDAAKS